MKRQKINFKAIAMAAGAGASYNFAIEGASKKVDFINENYLTVKTLGAGLIGSGMVYFGKTEDQRAAGYGLLGVAGASGASKLATVIVSSDGESMQGLSNRAKKVRNLIVSRMPQTKQQKRDFMGNFVRKPVGGGMQQPNKRTTPQNNVQSLASIYGLQAMSDLIYPS